MKTKWTARLIVAFLVLGIPAAWAGDERDAEIAALKQKVGEQDRQIKLVEDLLKQCVADYNNAMDRLANGSAAFKALQSNYTAALQRLGTTPSVSVYRQAPANDGTRESSDSLRRVNEINATNDVRDLTQDIHNFEFLHRFDR